MTTRVKGRHRKAASPVTPLSNAAPIARRGLAVAASSGLALTMIASAANAAGGSIDLSKSAGALNGETGIGTLAEGARDAVRTNAPVVVSTDLGPTDYERVVTDVAEDFVAEAPAPEPQVEEAAPQAETQTADTTTAADSTATPASTPASAPASSSSADSNPSAGSIAGLAVQFVGRPYVWGASGPDAFDCSGLVSYVYGQFGINLPHSSGGIYSQGTVVSASEAQAGDVIYWPGHVAIYMGDGTMVSAESEGVGVQQVPVRGGGTFLRF